MKRIKEKQVRQDEICDGPEEKKRIHMASQISFVLSFVSFLGDITAFLIIGVLFPG